MLRGFKRKGLTGLLAAAAVVLFAASPASASDHSGQLVDGNIVLDQGGPNEETIDLGDPGGGTGCTGNGLGLTATFDEPNVGDLTVDVSGDVVGQLGSQVFNLSLATGSLGSSSYSGAVATLDDLVLTFAAQELDPSTCAPTGVACSGAVTLDLQGDNTVGDPPVSEAFPPASGDKTFLNGGGQIFITSGNCGAAQVYHTKSIVFDNVELVWD